MESLESDVFSESWQNYTLIKRDINVEKLNNEPEEVTSDNSIHSCKNSTNEANETSSIKKKKLQPELVVCIDGLPIVKSEKDINGDGVDDYPLEKEDEYLIDKCNEKTIKEEYFSESEIIVQEELGIKEEHFDDSNISVQKELDIRDYQTIKEEYFIKSEIIIKEELDIKVEDERKEQFTARSAVGQVEKRHHASSRAAPLNQTGTNNCRFHLPESPVFKCLDCTYQTYRRQCMSRHVLNHMEKTLECSHCSYKTRNKEVFRRHGKIHVPKEQIKLHQCRECSYTSIRKHNLTRHMLKHKESDDVIWYQCPECPYQTKHPGALTRQHMFIHKKDAPMHKCTLCLYETFQKRHLTQHMQRVHTPNGIQLIHCQEKGCSYKTHDKSYLARHVKVHKFNYNLNPGRILKCSDCSYETEQARNFRAHRLVHEVGQWFYCYLCTLKTLRKWTLARHIRRMHRDSNGRINDRANKK